jgi:hypothetical protein
MLGKMRTSFVLVLRHVRPSLIALPAEQKFSFGTVLVAGLA